MTKIGILGAGAFGTALAVTLGQEQPVSLWMRDAVQAGKMAKQRESRRLPGVRLPEAVEPTAEIARLSSAEVVLIALPMQQIAWFLEAEGKLLDGKRLVACAKGIDLHSGRGATAIISDTCPDATPAVLTGPSFAADIAAGLPTALTLACADAAAGEEIQSLLSTATLRLYRTTDVTGAELGGALKNVIAIAAGMVMGAGLGDSARAAVMTRGYAEMLRLAVALGARAETLAGLSGLGDLVLTCTSDLSRNFRFGYALGAGAESDATATVEGVATATAVTRLALARGIEMPITAMVAAVIDQKTTLPDAMASLLSRPLKEE